MAGSHLYIWFFMSKDSRCHGWQPFLLKENVFGVISLGRLQWQAGSKVMADRQPFPDLMKESCSYGLVLCIVASAFAVLHLFGHIWVSTSISAGGALESEWFLRQFPRRADSSATRWDEAPTHIWLAVTNRKLKLANELETELNLD